MKKGFTLMELLAVIVVIGILSIVTIPIITGVVNKARVNALKVSAEGLVDSARLYTAQYQNEGTVRFDISNNVIRSGDTNNILKYKGNIKDGTVIIDTKGRSVICVTDGKRSAYKNYSENIISVSINKTCNIPAGGSIVYLGNEATITELSNQELTQKITQIETKLANLENENKELKKGINPVGTIISYSTATVPEGYLKCEGQAVSRTEYAALFEKIGTTYGAGDGSTTFNVPDLRGEFLRGTGTNSHSGQGNGANVGVHQDNGLPNITGAFYSYVWDTAQGSGAIVKSINNSKGVDGSIAGSEYDYWSFDASRSSSIYGKSNYVTPTNTSVLFCIKY